MLRAYLNAETGQENVVCTFTRDRTRTVSVLGFLGYSDKDSSDDLEDCCDRVRNDETCPSVTALVAGRFRREW